MTISFLVLTAIAYLPYWLEKRSCNQPYTWEDMLNLTKDEADYMRRVNGGEPAVQPKKREPVAGRAFMVVLMAFNVWFTFWGPYA